jgi:hypothetical protein
MDDSLEEELMAVEAIFPEFIHRDTHHPRHILISPSPNGQPRLVSFRLIFPKEYPDAPPSCISITGHGLSPEPVLEAIQDCWTPGEPCIFAIVERLKETFEEKADHLEINSTEKDVSKSKSAENLGDIADHVDFEFAVSNPIIDRKSTFIGRAIEVHSRREATTALQWLKQSDKKVARATHNVVAWRICESGILIQGTDSIRSWNLFVRR